MNGNISEHNQAIQG